jgi:hypothetical protein
MHDLQSPSPRSTRPPQRPLALDPKPVLPPVETPEGAPDLGFLIAYEEPEAPDGWASGIVKAVEDGLEGRHFTIDTKAGEQEVPRKLVFYWWPLD